MTTRSETFQALFRHVVYSPHGEHEGVLLERGGEPLQLVFEHGDEAAPRAFAGVRPGQTVDVEAVPAGPSPKGRGEHPVYAFARLVGVDGAPPPQPAAPPGGPAYRGKVVRLNFARHGAANGVVLDSGDFIHTRPDGMAKLKLRVGDPVEADGDAQRLADDSGWAVEATTVNGKPLKHHH